MIGLGTEAIEKVKTKNFSLDLASLENQLKESKKKGDQILSVVLNAGDSRTLTIDPLREAIEIVRSIEPLAWVHVDACHGGQLLFSHKHKERIRGIELADSISLDPHKVFNLPYTLSYFLFKDPRENEGFWTSSSLITSDPWALGQLTPNIGSKTWSTLKFYLLLEHLGAQQLGTVIDNRIAMAHKFRAIVGRNPCFKLLTNHSDLNSVPFFYVGSDQTDSIQSESFLYALNEKIYKNMLRQGDFYLHGFPIRDDCNTLGCGREQRVFVLRYMCGNPTITEEDLETLMTKLCAVAEETAQSFASKNCLDPA
jgi:L-2,4-diaminobutyrate decarboxylase